LKKTAAIQSSMEEFRIFKSEAEAEDLASWMCRRRIPAQVKNITPNFDPSFAHSLLTRTWIVELPAADFERASEALQHFYDQRLSAVPDDYYLFEFNDAELLEILQKPDQWGDLDYALAAALLRERGICPDENVLRRWRSQRYAALAEPDQEDNSGLVITGYFLAFAGGLLGALSGWYLQHSQKLLPDGRKVYRYPEKVRRQGRIIFRFGVVMTVTLSVGYLYWSYKLRTGM
jgi:hypothetical protein